jgi:hypothetical protein
MLLESRNLWRGIFLRKEERNKARTGANARANQRLGRSVALLSAGHFTAYAVRRHRMAKESEDAEEEELSSVDPTEYTQSVDVATGPQQPEPTQEA